MRLLRAFTTVINIGISALYIEVRDAHPKGPVWKTLLLKKEVREGHAIFPLLMSQWLVCWCV